MSAVLDSPDIDFLEKEVLSFEEQNGELLGDDEPPVAVGCSGGCTGNCWQSCYNSCDGSCYRTCYGSCQGSAAGGRR